MPSVIPSSEISSSISTVNDWLPCPNRNFSKSLRSFRTFSSHVNDTFCHATSVSTSLMVSIFACTCGNVAFSCNFSAMVCTDWMGLLALVSSSSNDSSISKTSKSNFLAFSSKVFLGNSGAISLLSVLTSTSEIYTQASSSLKRLTSAHFSLTEIWLSDNTDTCSFSNAFISS